MRIPDELREAIETAVAGVPGGALGRSAAELSERYRNEASTGARMATPEHRLAYAAVRLPATYAATYAALAAAAARVPSERITSMLDLGAGPGTAGWAATDAFADIERMTLVEHDAELVALGKRLATHSPDRALAHATWKSAEVDRMAFEPHDLVVASYVVGELNAPAAARTIDGAFRAATTLLVIVEPGTPGGFERIRAARTRLVEAGGHVVAPCPHDVECPMPERDWCHFAARVERTSLHRRLKGGELGHEDEKFSYVAVAKEPFEPAPARILRHPLKREGHTYLDLCTRDGLTRIVVGRRDRAAHRRAHKAKWGDEWNG